MYVCEDRLTFQGEIGDFGHFGMGSFRGPKYVVKLGTAKRFLHFLYANALGITDTTCNVTCLFDEWIGNVLP